MLMGCVIVFGCAANEVECVITGGGWSINDWGGVWEENEV